MSEWKYEKFSNLCDIVRGGSPRPINEWLASEGIPWVKISDVSRSGTRYISCTNEFIKPAGKLKSRTVYPGDLILSNSATPGIPMFMNIEACIHDGWLLLRNFRGLDKLFCFYLLKNERNKLVNQGNGSVFTNLKTEILKEHYVRIPPLSEQKAIAHILGSLDDRSN
jgi:Restriction endonuclease S subunits